MLLMRALLNNVFARGERQICTQEDSEVCLRSKLEKAVINATKAFEAARQNDPAGLLIIYLCSDAILNSFSGCFDSQVTGLLKDKKGMQESYQQNELEVCIQLVNVLRRAIAPRIYLLSVAALAFNKPKSPSQDTSCTSNVKSKIVVNQLQFIILSCLPRILNFPKVAKELESEESLIKRKSFHKKVHIDLFKVLGNVHDGIHAVSQMKVF